ncbi:gluconolactonase [Devosia subaequoris]|uniref:Gluconolactonase n=1 Tax=Devosia subaequoris TaxID=395930 RepID=A0A7W6IRF5_9HYPH|nr:SMP-30/gluconolactonase/LRE family protein [Devosia subaequoris]MBB4053917.1 gluconolactonase [Devosia subaequoris]MCP1211337.1 SMP-30/gluconolactonase/LRE family protein [Devosia subaequoris]
MTEHALYDIIDPRFAHKIVGSAGLEELHTGCRWTEGPVWFSDHDALYFSDIPNQQVLRYLPSDNSVSVYAKPSNFANGHTRDLEGRLISCEHGPRRVTRTEIDGTITVLAERFEGRRLNSPNDVVVKLDGSIWFTDPTYGILSDYEGYQSEPEQPVHGVYRIDGKTGEIRLMVGDFAQPNGLAFSPDESVLYVADSGASHDPAVPRHIRAFAVENGGLAARDLGPFAVIDNGIPDGFRVDTEGWVWCSAADGVHVFDDTGKLCGKILIPQTVSNLTFGGPKRNRLFITATTSLYALYVTARGAQTP